ncbi:MULTISPECIES: DUF3999 domain-containing protein [unclassified Polaromonas]|uniref:DUF3999 domain-containing protein n=1 Tax=unclassified Polaromonas TaxID=2638319 RepID=UPI000F074E1A|nr:MULTISPECIES: DUF3999 domain-containing protein [unclassified Polaromonas]AYQ28274.1 DUF3999 domain-containing protein [Polaromonas sp. SP1]QGJ20605.1 DUF3999 family protein [Polaromonas sp. Pch-P]
MKLKLPFLGLALSAGLTAPLMVLAADAPDAANARSYAIRIPVTAAPDAPLQRLLLPAEALVRLQSAGYADLRLFNAAGQPVPMALAQVPTVNSAEEQQVKLQAYPILGSATSTAAGLEGLSLRIEERQGRRVVQLNTGGGTTAGPASQQKVLGALLDARAVNVPAVRLTLDADLPVGQPVTFNVQASKDLKSWRAVADTVLFRADASAPAASLGDSSLALSMAELKDHYLRITWGDAAVTLRGATLVTSRNTATRERVNATMAAPAMAGPRELSFALPFATPVAALKITPKESNVLVPLRVLGRNDRNQPWTLLATAVVYRLTTAGKEQTSGPVELQGASVREVKIEADAKTPGFASAPDIALQFEPAQLVFLASGQGPFTLAAGLAGPAGAAGAFLPMASLIPGYKAAQENALPLAKADVSKADATGGSAGVGGPLVAAQAPGDGIPTRTLVLWGILLLGALALGAMAWVLMKQTRQPPAQ